MNHDSGPPLSDILLHALYVFQIGTWTEAKGVELGGSADGDSGGDEYASKDEL